MGTTNWGLEPLQSGYGFARKIATSTGTSLAAVLSVFDLLLSVVVVTVFVDHWWCVEDGCWS